MQQISFPLGRVLATQGAQEALCAAGDSFQTYLDRHARGDWGELEPYDQRANNDALKQGSRLLSAYHTSGGENLWIITEADRSATTILLPSEY